MKKIQIVFLTMLLACGGSKENPIILESLEIHKSAMDVSKGVVEKIKEMNTLAEGLEEDAALKESLAALKQDFIDWEAAIVEVPGHEHDHHDHSGHDHDHDHDHSPSTDLTPEMVLEIQKEMKKNIESLNTRSEELLDKLKKES